MIVNELKEVYFDIYCPQCKHYDESESEDPCWNCLDNPVNLNSHRPVDFQEVEK